jgi:hypothetical protein
MIRRMIGQFVNDEIERMWREAPIAHVGFEVLTPVVMKSSVSWDLTQCTALKLHLRFCGFLV